MAQIISIANQKGGVGKTTTAFNLAVALSHRQKKVLMIDNDPQCNLTSYSGNKMEPYPVTVDDLYLTRRKPLEISELLSLDRSLHLLPSDEGLAGAEYYLFHRPDKEIVLKSALSEVKDHFDFIIIDNPPALNLLTINGLVASTGVLVPVQLEFFSLEGIVLLQRTINSLQKLNPALSILGIIPSMVNGRRKLSLEVLSALKEQFQQILFETRIHDNVKIAESSGHGRSILDYAPGSQSSSEFRALAQEVLSHVASK